jgi:hypothetical protein
MASARLAPPGERPAPPQFAGTGEGNLIQHPPEIVTPVRDRVLVWMAHWV